MVHHLWFKLMVLQSMGVGLYSLILGILQIKRILRKKIPWYDFSLDRKVESSKLIIDEIQFLGFLISFL